MRGTRMKTILTCALICGVFLTPFSSAARDKEIERGNIYDDQHKETGHWRANESTEEIIIFDELYREKYRINTENGRVFDRLHRQIGETDQEP